MIRFENILAAQDVSDCSEQSLRAAVQLARDSGARLHEVYAHVLHDDPFTPTVAQDHMDQVRAALDDGVTLATGTSELLDIKNVVLRDVSAASAIVHHAADNKIDLIVLGTHGRRGLRRMVLGSVAEEVVRMAGCAVLTVHPGDRTEILESDQEAEILLPLDFSKSSMAAVPLARELASMNRARLRVLHVVQETVYPAFYDAGAFSLYDAQPDIEEHALAHLKEAYSRTAGPIVPVVFEVLVGHPAAEIARRAEELGAGMIVMATHGLGGMAHHGQCR
ncbi:MAG: nucleotide-binding universal stress UspA family protein [Rhodothermales bacterium]|jgi:nucleotide-binding universal stress UspA family protein